MARIAMAQGARVRRRPLVMLLVAAAALCALLACGAGLARAAQSGASASPSAPAPVAAAPAAPTLALTAAPAAVVAGQATVLGAVLTAPDTTAIAGQTLTLSAEAAGESAFTMLAQATTGADGSVAFTESPSATTTYRVDFAGSSDWAPAFAQTSVGVAPLVTLTAPATVMGWRTARFAIAVSPERPGATVALQRRSGHAWVTWHRLTLGADSTVVGRFRATAVGRFAYRVTVAADAGHTAGASGGVAVRVKSPNSYGVPLAAAQFIVVDKSQYKLYYLQHGWVIRVFDCVLGRPALPTPLGHFHIYAKDPRMGGPYGPRRMRYLGLYAIHGTDEPWLLHRFPRNYSHGCTRLSDAHILWLYPRCPVGTPVWNVP
jgi:lipoprotein-anchoring transpeptidase ErfK/SrfK